MKGILGFRWRRPDGRELILDPREVDVMVASDSAALVVAVFQDALSEDDALAWSISLTTLADFDLSKRRVALGKEQSWTDVQTRRIAADCIVMGLSPRTLRAALVSENDQRMAREGLDKL